MDKWKESAHVLSHVWLFVAPWTVARQAPLSMEFPRQEYWSGLPFSSSGNLPNPEIKLLSPAMQADSLPLLPPRKPKSKVLCSITVHKVICRCWCSAQSPQSCPTLCTSMHCSTPGSSVHGIPQAGILEWVAMPSSRGSSPPRDRTYTLLGLLHWQAGCLPMSQGSPICKCLGIMIS